MPSATTLPDSRGRFGPFGGKYAPETLMSALAELENASREAQADGAFQAQLSALLRDYAGRLTFDPHLPAEWPSLEFSLTVENRGLDVEVTHDRLEFALRDGNDLTVWVRDEEIKLVSGETTTVEL